MTKLDDFMKSQQREPVRGMEMDISARCHTCMVSVDEAEYFPNDKVLKWTCPEGHQSFIEGFSL